jgi:rare lipoprotein A
LRSKFPLRRMRSVQLIIATTTLAAPATALALTGVTTASGQTVPNPLNLQVSPRQVSFGHAVTVNGSAPAADAGKDVQLETATGSGSAWRPVASSRIGSNGRFRFRVVPRSSGLLRAVAQLPAGSGPTPLVASATGGPAAGGGDSAASSLKPVTVAARFAVARRQFAILGSGLMKVAGELLPAAPGRTVKLQGHTAGGWRTLTTGRTGGRGRFTLRYAPQGGTGRRLRVLFGGDSRNTRTTGSAGSVTVFDPTVASWYEDAGNTACGFHAGLGVANRTLPCGTKVEFHYGGRTVNAVVDDRGPYVGGRDWDLNQNTAAALGFAGVGTVWVSGA